jgi:hypothetical protein
MEYVRRLVDLRYIGADAIEVVQSKRDPPTHGIGLQLIGRVEGEAMAPDMGIVLGKVTMRLEAD